ncbi:iron-sulfur cluster insertion protein ErpA [bacterium BMS3Abin04]|nr:iron-sulfur cluster insertion protein ErpA [bacterium BMS3Abin04]
MNSKINDKSILVSERAQSQIKKIREENSIPQNHGLRVSVKGGGCSGLTYNIEFDDVISSTDTIIEHSNLKIYVDGKSLFYLMGTELDFSDGLNGKGFIFNNPNAAKTCNCGESFSI